MTSTAYVDQVENGWRVRVSWGSLMEDHGVYRWHWLARLVAWLNNGIH